MNAEAELLALLKRDALEWHRRNGGIVVTGDDSEDDGHDHDDRPEPEPEPEPERSPTAGLTVLRRDAKKRRDAIRRKADKGRATRRMRIGTQDHVRADLCGSDSDELSEAIGFREQVRRGER